MERTKVWAILGNIDGLTPAAIKYLLAKNQIVIAIVEDGKKRDLLIDINSIRLEIISINIVDYQTTAKAMESVIQKYGLLDVLINNSNYRLFESIAFTSKTKIGSIAIRNSSYTINLLKSFLSYLKKDGKGHIINIPPLLCLATETNKNSINQKLVFLDAFLETLLKGLSALDVKLTFLMPGDRLM